MKHNATILYVFLALHLFINGVSSAVTSSEETAPFDGQASMSLNRRHPGETPITDLMPVLKSRIIRNSNYLSCQTIDVGIPPEGDMPQDVTITPDHTQVLTCYSYSDSMTLLDIATETMRSADTGGYPVGIAVTSDGAMVVTANLATNDLTVIDIATGAVIRTISLNQLPPDICDQPAIIETIPGSHLVVVGCDVSNTFHVVDLDTGFETGVMTGAPVWIRTFSWSSDTGKGYAEWNRIRPLPDGSRVLVPYWSDTIHELWFFNPLTASVTDVLPLEAAPLSIEITPDGTRALISHATGNKITVVDPQYPPSIVDTYTMGFTFYGDRALITPDGQYALVDGPSNSATIVRISDGSVASTVSTGSVGGFACTPDSLYGFCGNFNSRIFELFSPYNVVKTITLGSVTSTAYCPDYPIAAAINSTFSEEIYVYDINGPSGYELASVWGGIPPEGDGPRAVAVSPDGMKAAVANILSDTVSVVDLTGTSILGIASVGQRPGDISVTLDGNYAVCANLDESFVSIVDIDAVSTVASVASGVRPARVALTPDGNRALVSSINNGGGTDRVSVIHLSGATSYNEANITTGDQRTVPVSYFTTQGLDIDINGTFAIQCTYTSTSGDDESVDIIDLSTLTVVKQLVTGQLPAEVKFSPVTVSRALVTNFESDTVSALTIAGALSYVETTIPVGNGPYLIEFTPDGEFAFVANYLTPCSISMIRMSDLANAGTISLTSGQTPRNMQMNAGGSYLFVATLEGDFIRVLVDGTSSHIVETLPIGSPACDLAISESLSVALVPEVTWDTLDVIQLEEPTPTPPPPVPAMGEPGIGILLLIVGILFLTLLHRRPNRSYRHNQPGPSPRI